MKQNGSKKLRCARSVTSSAGFLRGGKTATHGTSGLAAVRRYITGSAMIPLKYYWMIYLQSDYKVLSFSFLSNDSVGGARILDHATIHPHGQGWVLPNLQPPLGSIHRVRRRNPKVSGPSIAARVVKKSNHGSVGPPASCRYV
jgi:hypothetical protein